MNTAADAKAHVKPWYRQFWPWFLIAIPLAGVLTAGITTAYAYRNTDIEMRKVDLAPLNKTSWESRR